VSDSDSFIREVTEEVRQDRMYRFWKRFGPYVIGLIVLIVAASAGWAWYQNEQRAAARERGGAFLSAERDVEGLSALVAELEDPEPLALARLQLAAAEAEAGNDAAAAATYRAVAEEGALDRAYTDIARLHALRLEAPGMALADAEAALATLAEEGAPYRALALELRAVLRLNAGEREGARADLEAILAEPGLSRGLNARTRQLLAILGERAAAPE
jgi:hypothetical protein